MSFVNVTANVQTLQGAQLIAPDATEGTAQCTLEDALSLAASHGYVGDITAYMDAVKGLMWRLRLNINGVDQFANVGDVIVINTTTATATLMTMAAFNANYTTG